MTLIKRYRVLGAKAETTPGTAESLTNAEGSYNAYNIVINNEIDVEEREGQGAFGYLSSLVTGYKGRITFSTDVSWDGTATEPSWELFLTGCGWVKSGQVFTPRTEAPGSNVKTLTMGVDLKSSESSAVRKTLRGCAGTFKMVCVTGKVARIDWDYMGVWVAVADGTPLAPTYPTARGLRYATSTTTYASTALCVENLTLDSGNTVIMRECAATVAGYESAIIVNRNPKVTGNPEAKLVATRDSYGQFLGMSEGILTWGLDGPTNSVLTVSAPKAQIIKISEGDRNGLVTDEIEWQLNKNASAVDEEVSLTFTAAS